MIHKLVKLFKPILTMLCVVSLLLVSNTSLALSKSVNQKAMDVAEKQSKGKALGAKLVQEGNKKGYKVRIIKGGKVSHLFIPLSQLKN